MHEATLKYRQSFGSKKDSGRYTKNLANTEKVKISDRTFKKTILREMLMFKNIDLRNVKGSSWDIFGPIYLFSLEYEKWEASIGIGWQNFGSSPWLPLNPI